MPTARTLLSFAKKINAIARLKNLHETAFSDKYLLGTNVFISFCLSSTGDILEQQYEKYCGYLTEWDYTRTKHMGVSGVTVGVICHYWYQYLDRRMPGRTLPIVMKKILLDQLICSPIYIIAFFLTVNTLEKKTLAESYQEMKQKAWRLYAAEWLIWPPAQFINFFWLPTKYRVFYDNLISLSYDVYSSHVKHDD